MGMAASQARFLGLTARKSNVEYQGQQVNQQRTALANESANLYNQMMDLTVPTPPSTTEYTNTVYVLDDSSNNNTVGNYSIKNITKLYDGSGNYKVQLSYKYEEVQNDDMSFEFTYKAVDGDLQTYTFLSGLKLTHNTATGENLVRPFNAKGDFEPKENQIYSIASLTDTTDTTKPQYDINDISGYKECKATADERAKKSDGTTDTDKQLAYFYKDKNGKFNFLTTEQMTKMISAQAGQIPESSNGSNVIDTSRGKTVTKTNNSIEVTATLEKGETGRITNIKIADNAPALAGNEYSVSAVQEFDEDGYNDAFNEYQYQKALYEQRINEINAQTEIIQHQDQQLELRLDQLDTEQNAIKTEMDSVTKVIDDNVEKTFKTFA